MKMAHVVDGRRLIRVFSVRPKVLGSQKEEQVEGAVNGLLQFVAKVNFLIHLYGEVRPAVEADFPEAPSAGLARRIAENPSFAAFREAEAHHARRLQAQHRPLPSYFLVVSSEIQNGDIDGAYIVLEERTRVVRGAAKIIRLEVVDLPLQAGDAPLPGVWRRSLPADILRNLTGRGPVGRWLYRDRLVLGDGHVFRGYYTVLHRRLSQEWLHRPFWTQLPCEVRYGLHIQPYPPLRARTLLRASLDSIGGEKTRNNFVSKVDAEERSAYDDAYAEAEHGVPSARVKLCLALVARDEKSLTLGEEMMRDALGAVGVQLVVAKREQIDLLRFTTPIGVVRW